MKKYDHLKAGKKWQKAWDKEGVYTAKDGGKKSKRYVLIEFPYPSGEGLHMGHLRPYAAGDVYSRYLRMEGHEVMFPMGWDAFGLPAENYAIKKGIHPSKTTAKNISNAKSQVRNWGISFDWSREVTTTDPEYYKWTQWIFLQFWKKGLAYESTGNINWCPKDRTGLANEEVQGGRCERCGTEVEQKEMRQWYLKITAYAEKLLKGLEALKWPEQVKLQQKNWIGKSEGAEISFPVDIPRNYVLLHGFNGGPKDIFFPWLKKELERSGSKVYAPELPNSKKPREDEQIQKVLNGASFDENTVLFGHSLGAVVALKVLEKLNKKIAGLVLAGGFASPDFLDKERPFRDTFSWGFDWEAIKKNAGNITILADKNDYAVPISQARFLHEKLGGRLIETEGREVHFTAKQEPELLENLLPQVKVFTTRIDTIFSGTYLILAPEHPLLDAITTSENKAALNAYKGRTLQASEEDRTALDRKKTGVFTGSYARNPATGDAMPIWVSDFVLGAYGTGAVFADAHDERDFELAKLYDIPLKVSIRPENEELWQKVSKLEVCFSGEGILVNSGQFDGLSSAEARPKIIAWLAKEGLAKPRTTYHLRDWVFSRQRYWGEPIPLIHCEKCGTVPVPEKDLPVTLPPVKKYEPTGTGESPLADVKKWVNTSCPKCKGPAKRETNTMPQWAGSSWYYLRYADPKNKKRFAAPALLKRWLPVDVYFGGMEHTTLHLLYSRFWHLLLYDLKLVPTSEPYARRIPHGIILGPDGEKMSKSRGNVVNPNDVVAKLGADALRMHEMFLGPHEGTVAWNDKGIFGITRFLDRAWRALEGETSKKTPLEVSKSLHRAIQRVGEDIRSFRFNTAISALMIFMNDVGDAALDRSSKEAFVKLLAPFAPFMAEEVWRGSLGHRTSIHRESWPKADPKLLKEETFELVVQVNGKLRTTLTVPQAISEKDAVGLVLKEPKIIEILAGKEPRRVIFVPGRLVNLVV